MNLTWSLWLVNRSLAVSVLKFKAKFWIRLMKKVWKIRRSHTLPLIMEGTWRLRMDLPREVTGTVFIKIGKTLWLYRKL